MMNLQDMHSPRTSEKADVQSPSRSCLSWLLGACLLVGAAYYVAMQLLPQLVGQKIALGDASEPPAVAATVTTTTRRFAKVQFLTTAGPQFACSRFGSADEDGDGLISTEELEQQRTHFSADQMEILGRGDLDGDGSLKKAEFEAALLRAGAATSAASGWSDEKKAWCCEQESIGCARPYVQAELTVQNVNYDALVQDDGLRQEFEQAVRANILRELGAAAGVTADMISVQLVQGSVKVVTRITPPEGVTTDSISSSLSGAGNLEEEIVESISAVSGIDKATTGPIQAQGKMAVQQVEPSVQETAAPATTAMPAAAPATATSTTLTATSTTATATSTTATATATSTLTATSTTGTTTSTTITTTTTITRTTTTTTTHTTTSTTITTTSTTTTTTTTTIHRDAYDFAFNR